MQLALDPNLPPIPPPVGDLAASGPAGPDADRGLPGRAGGFIPDMNSSAAAPNFVVAGAAPAPDGWEAVPPAGAAGAPAAGQADQEFQNLATNDANPMQRVAGLMLATALLVASAAASYYYFVEGVDPLTWVMELLGLGEPPPLEEAPPPVAKAKPEPPPPPPPKVKVVAGNPYWHLPNAIVADGKSGFETPLGRTWTAEEEENWRSGLSHRYTYQRWRTVMDVRKQRLRGSEAILVDALKEPKFWTRMYAAFGLAEFGIPVSLKTIDQVLVGARSELVRDFFERFAKRCSPGQCYMLRQVVRLVDEKGRLMALQGIARSRDSLRDVYLTAATLDPGPRVRRWITQYLDNKPIDPDKFNELMPIAKGEVSGERLLRGIAIAKAPSPPLEAAEAEVDASIEQELNALDQDTGDLDVHAPTDEGPAVNDVPDADTFEYAE